MPLLQAISQVQLSTTTLMPNPAQRSELDQPLTSCSRQGNSRQDHTAPQRHSAASQGGNKCPLKCEACKWAITRGARHTHTHTHTHTPAPHAPALALLLQAGHQQLVVLSGLRLAVLQGALLQGSPAPLALQHLQAATGSRRSTRSGIEGV